MKKFKILLLLILTMLLTGCLSATFEYMPKVNVNDEEVPKVIIGCKYLNDSYDYNLALDGDELYFTFRTYVGLTEELQTGYNEELDAYFLGLSIMALTPESAEKEFRYGPVGEYLIIGNDSAILYDIARANKEIYNNTKKDDNGNYIMEYYRNLSVSSINKNKEGTIVIQAREVYHKVYEDIYLSGEIYQLILHYKVKGITRASVEVSLGE